MDYKKAASLVALAKAGDQDAKMALLDEVKFNLLQVAKKFVDGDGEDSVKKKMALDDAMQIATLAFLELVETIKDSDAPMIFVKVKDVALQALLEATVDGSVSYKSVQNLTSATKAMQEDLYKHSAPEQSTEKVGLSAAEAAEQFGVSMNLLFNYTTLSAPLSYEMTFDEAYDPENPYADKEHASGEVLDDFNPHDPEFSNVQSADVVAAKCQSTNGVATDTSSAMVNALADLTPKQQQVMSMTANGMSVTDIAAELGIAFQTVANTKSQAIKALVKSPYLQKYVAQ
jgi:DNA-binding CsgD family transcriptional regulator